MAIGCDLNTCMMMMEHISKLLLIEELIMPKP